jgi:hypothetical protein
MTPFTDEPAGMTTLPFRLTDFTKVPLKLPPALLVLELNVLEIRVEKEVPAGRIRGTGGAGGTGAGEEAG